MGFVVKREVSSRENFSALYERDVAETSIIKGITSVMLVELYSIVLKISVPSDVLIYFGAFSPVVIRQECCKK